MNNYPFASLENERKLIWRDINWARNDLLSEMSTIIYSILYASKEDKTFYSWMRMRILQNIIVANFLSVQNNSLWNPSSQCYCILLPSFLDRSRTRYTIDDVFFVCLPLVCKLTIRQERNTEREYCLAIVCHVWNPRTLPFNTTTYIVSRSLFITRKKRKEKRENCLRYLHTHLF